MYLGYRFYTFVYVEFSRITLKKSGLHIFPCTINCQTRVEGDAHDHDRSLSPHVSAGSPWAMTPMGGRGIRAGLSLHPRTLRGEVLSRTPRGIPPPWRGLRPPAPQQERPGDLPPVTGGIPQHLTW